MLTKKKIEQYKENNRLNLKFNFLINRNDKVKLEKIADKNNVSISELLRILIKECIKEPNEIDVTKIE